jgi:hypothetical protein
MTCRHQSRLSFAIEQNLWKRRISTTHPISQRMYRCPSRLAYSPAPQPNSITHKQPPDLGSESASLSPAFLALSTAINQRLAEEQLHPYLYLEPKDSSTTVVVSSSGILNPPHRFPELPNPRVVRRTAAHRNARNGIQTLVLTRRPFQVD